MIDEKLIQRINYLANKKKISGLTKEETIEQQELREEYLQLFKEGFKQQLSGYKVEDKKE